MSEPLCRRVGPGRLPYASRHDVGAGIAMAATGLLAVVVWFGVSGLLLVTDAVPAVTGGVDLESAVGFGVLFAPFAVPTSFVAGTVCWRVADRDALDRTTGALLGACTAVIGMIGGAVGIALVFAVWGVSNGALAAGEALLYFVFVAVSAFLLAAAYAGWMIVPLGAAGGWYHERAKTVADDSR